MESRPKLGAAYNVFDCEELLEASIRSIKPVAEYVCIVYQTVSNFGMACNPGLEDELNRLVEIGLVDEIVYYKPREFSNAEKKKLISPHAPLGGLGVGSYREISNQFFNEMEKREIGLKKARAAGCTHYMSMDADEFYMRDQLKAALMTCHQRGYEGSACKMRYFYKHPTCELMPMEETNYVPLIFKISDDSDFKLAHPYPCIVDPTRTMYKVRRFKIFERSEVEMYHYSFVRKNMLMKLLNVSNRDNYRVSGNIQEFLVKFERWTPEQPLAHPHPYFAKQFKEIRTVPNWFDINISSSSSSSS